MLDFYCNERMGFLTFKGGIHPPEKKDLTAFKTIEEAPSPSLLVLPLSQHIGAPLSALVAVGEEVKEGQLIADSEAFVSAPLHAPLSGKIKSIGPRLTFTGVKINSIVIEVSDSQEKTGLMPLTEDDLTPEKIKSRAREAGLVGLGGAAFPTHVKLSPPADKPVDTVLVNGCECEPYLTCDHRLMLEEPEEILSGLKLIMLALGAKKGLIVVEDNKRDAAEKLSRVVEREKDIEVVLVKTKYPQGSEKHLIKAVLNREVPSGALPFEVGAYVQNVQTTIALSKAFWKGEPLTERVITISGEAISEPKNLRIKIGTPAKEVIDFCGGFSARPDKVVFGGPMTGFSIFDFSVPIQKGTSGILALKTGEREVGDKSNECLRCGRCIEVCPVFLMPVTLANLVLIDDVDGFEKKGALDCIECGSCAFVCPTRRPLVQLIRYAKSKILARKKQ